MEQYVIRGGNPLVGEVEIGGAKNAALAILTAYVPDVPLKIQCLSCGVCRIPSDIPAYSGDPENKNVSYPVLSRTPFGTSRTPNAIMPHLHRHPTV